MCPAAGSRQESGLSAAPSTKTAAEHSCLDKSRPPREGQEGCGNLKIYGRRREEAANTAISQPDRTQPSPPRDPTWRRIHFNAVAHPTDTIKKSCWLCGPQHFPNSHHAAATCYTSGPISQSEQDTARTAHLQLLIGGFLNEFLSG